MDAGRSAKIKIHERRDRWRTETAEKLGAGLDFIRVDLYDTGERIYFGRMTATPAAGLARFEPRTMDDELGRLWEGSRAGRRSIRRLHPLRRAGRSVPS